MSDKAQLKKPASKCDCAITVRKKDVQIQKMETKIAKLRKQRDLAESRLEDFMRMIEHHHALKSGTPYFGNHTNKWEDDGSVSDTSGVVDLDTRSFMSDDDDDVNEELPMCSENPSDEYCREVQCIETEESATVYSNNNHKEEKEETKNVVGHSEYANDETSVVGQNVNHRDTVPEKSTPPQKLGADFLERQEESVFPDFELGSSVSRRKDSMSSCGSSCNSSGIPTPLGEEGGISTVRAFVDGIKELAKRHQEDSSKMGRELAVDSMEGDFERQRKEILVLWGTCNISLVHRTYFYLLFKGNDKDDSVYIGVELRRLLFMKDRFSQGKQALQGGETLTLASSRKVLEKERKMLSKLVKKRFSEEERARIYHKFGIAVNSKDRRLQLVNKLWSNPKDMTQVVESADVVAKLVKFTEQGKATKEMFGLAFKPPSLLKARGWRKPTLF
ncbi:unnamed protein product [Eruca vesicaria subsp. sativa]|uniref:NPK1-activating kinesin-like protein C-terminal domain-containing protein n=1 Tax=Eruca vesicaria subsp. sativa TaxID=29727 RepID=A0ABC8KDR6_ERUVS|nr:unnamed protein product [Eruca vesicaria subsp. sativa]